MPSRLSLGSSASCFGRSASSQCQDRDPVDVRQRRLGAWLSILQRFAQKCLGSLERAVFALWTRALRTALRFRAPEIDFKRHVSAVSGPATLFHFAPNRGQNITAFPAKGDIVNSRIDRKKRGTKQCVCLLLLLSSSLPRSASAAASAITRRPLSLSP